MAIGTSRITSKGQLTIPQEMRKRKGLAAGTDVVLLETQEGVLVKRAVDFEDLVRPFREMAKNAKLTRSEVRRLVIDEKKRTVKRLGIDKL
ncbi:MAG: AbrB/MazE/SpoVT family DNA-binding domain-containing protein [Candidatus Micrarchaeota archaeon]